AIHPDFILAGTNNDDPYTLRHTIFKSTNNALTWDPLNIKWIYSQPYNKVYAFENYAAVPAMGYFSQDRGYTWTAALYNPYPVGPMNILPN
ncbi:hypothetical protein SB725_31140, partial [Pseudomonas sp. SIMBA_041]